MKHFILNILVCFLFMGTVHSQGYDHIGKFGTHGRPWALVEKNDRFGFIDTDGEVIVPIEYDQIGKFNTHARPWALVEKDGKFGFIDADGEVVVPIEQERPDPLYMKCESKRDSVTSSNTFKFLNKSYPVPQGSSIWEAQLDKIMGHHALSENNLELTGYQYKREIRSLNHLKRIKNKMIRKANYFPVYHRDRSSTPGFDIRNMNKASSVFGDCLNRFIPTSKKFLQALPSGDGHSHLSDQFYVFRENDLSLVELEWQYEDKTLNTLCLVSDQEGIVFDRFLYLIHSKYDVSDQSTGSMHSERKNPAGINYHWDKGQAAYNLYGLQLWKYNIEVHVEGMEDGDEKSIIGYSTRAKNRSGPFYKCVANARNKSFKRGEEGHLDFEWSYEYESAWGKNSGAGGEKLVIPEELD